MSSACSVARGLFVLHVAMRMGLNVSVCGRLRSMTPKRVPPGWRTVPAKSRPYLGTPMSICSNSLQKHAASQRCRRRLRCPDVKGACRSFVTIPPVSHRAPALLRLTFFHGVRRCMNTYVQPSGQRQRASDRHVESTLLFASMHSYKHFFSEPHRLSREFLFHYANPGCLTNWISPAWRHERSLQPAILTLTVCSRTLSDFPPGRIAPFRPKWPVGKPWSNLAASSRRCI